MGFKFLNMLSTDIGIDLVGSPFFSLAIEMPGHINKPDRDRTYPAGDL